MPLDETQKAALKAQGLDAKTIAAIEAQQTTQAEQTAFQRVRAALFPQGIPEMGSLRDSIHGMVETTKGKYVDPTTGAIALGEGVYVDPSAGDPAQGVIFGPKSDAEGSYSWLNKAQNWGPKKVNEWRKRLAGLGYEVAPSGPFDETLRVSLEYYWKSKYFYGKVVPRDASMTSGVKARDVYDPVILRNDIRTMFNELYGEDPSDQELEIGQRHGLAIVRKALAAGATPEHAANKARETLTEDFLATPGAQVQMERQENIEENTQLRDTVFSLGVLF